MQHVYLSLTHTGNLLTAKSLIIHLEQYSSTETSTNLDSKLRLRNGERYSVTSVS